MIKAVLFDLDNTLALFDEGAFFQHYFQQITAVFADLIAPENFRRHLVDATVALQQADGGRTNLERFLDRFCAPWPQRRQEVWQRFEDFYRTIYPRLPLKVQRPAGVDRLFDQLVAEGRRLVIASNPVFPEFVQRMRMAWAGVDHLPFCWVTAIDNMHHCKPDPGYYEEVCDRIGVAPRHCLMVGNDPVNDMVAAVAGLHTYHTTDDADLGHVSLTVDDERRRTLAAGIPQPAFRGPIRGVAQALARIETAHPTR